MEEDPQSHDKGLFEYLESCLRHKNEAVVFEAARALCELKGISPKELSPAISVLQLFLGSSKPTLRFAAVRTLNKVAMTHPLLVTTCNLDMENLISDTNRSIATLAITTLLKTGAESSVDRLMKQISNFMNEITDEFKIVVIEAIRTLCLKFPQKHRNLINFLSAVLRDEGGFEFKKAIVDTLLAIMYDIPDTKEVVLTHLCEFIEDCEFTPLAVKVLHVLGKEGPSTTSPSKYIRYIYNRVILENANVRASAVSALAKFAVKLESLRPKILVLLRRCLVDNDDEVRDRATFYLSMLEQDFELAKELILDADLHLPLTNLETALAEYVRNPTDAPFDVATVPVDLPKDKRPKAATKAAAAEAAPAHNVYAEALAQIPDFVTLGNLFKSSKPVELTEKGADYSVNCVKHVFSEHIVFQFNITNTINDQLLENAIVKMDLSSLSDFSLEKVIPAVSLPCDTPGVCYVSLRRPPEYLTGSIGCILKFTSKDVDPQSGEAEEVGYDDQYQIEEVEVNMADYIHKTFISNFQTEWETVGADNEVVETFALSTMKNLTDAVKEIIDFLGMQPCERSDQVPPKKAKHILYLSGRGVGGVPVFVRARMKSDPSSGVNVELTVRSLSLGVSQAVATVFV
eukprot:TRINITY_DN486_c0_g1_i1.p1 TRINITY_DN486_c0_g1~~TRINITY_DN486_c0_g1_i1.p1  ORF type:complete len:630 (+),score=220.72 TRINITY_DN486_c0_g1_i1:908-2797(+)